MTSSKWKTALLPQNDKNHKQHCLPGITWVLKNQNWSPCSSKNATLLNLTATEVFFEGLTSEAFWSLITFSSFFILPYSWFTFGVVFVVKASPLEKKITTKYFQTTIFSLGVSGLKLSFTSMWKTAIFFLYFVNSCWDLVIVLFNGLLFHLFSLFTSSMSLAGSNSRAWWPVGPENINFRGHRLPLYVVQTMTSLHQFGA